MSFKGPWGADVLEAVEIEITRAKAKHPGDFHNAHEAYAVLLEEVDELWEEVKKNPAKMNTIEVLNWRQKKYTEAIQVAAMAIRFAVEVV